MCAIRQARYAGNAQGKACRVLEWPCSVSTRNKRPSVPLREDMYAKTRSCIHFAGKRIALHNTTVQKEECNLNLLDSLTSAHPREIAVCLMSQSSPTSNARTSIELIEWA